MTIDVAGYAVGLDQAGDVLLTLENTAGSTTTYGLGKALCVELSARLDTVVAIQGGSSEKL